MKGNNLKSSPLLFCRINEDCHRITASNNHSFFVFDREVNSWTWKVVIWNEDVFGGLKLIDSYQNSSILLIISSGDTPG